MTRSSIIFRVDASRAIGTGHMMRCLAFAQSCMDSEKKSVFICAMPPSPLEARILNEGITVHHIRSLRGSANDAEETLHIAAEERASWIVIDGYDFDETYQKLIRDGGCKLLCIDDYAHNDRYSCDVLLNQNIGVTAEMYEGKTDGAKLLLGPKYALLRREFLSYRSYKRIVSEHARNILITLGGAAPLAELKKIVRAVCAIEGDSLDVLLLVGGENAMHTNALKEETRTSHHTFTLCDAVSDMPERMRLADLAIAAGGSTSWELLFMGVPTVTGILAENQAGIASGLGESGLAINIGWYRTCSQETLANHVATLLADSALRTKMSRKQRMRVDGKGAARLVSNFLL